MGKQKNIHDFEITLNDGSVRKLSHWKGHYLLIVNTASKCGYTPQYEGLEKLYLQFKDKPLTVLGFPCNQFGGQEPASDAEIAQFCKLSFGVSFPLSQKIDVRGDNAHPLFVFLCEALPGLLGSKAIKWNFTKFLIDPEGRPLERFAPKDTPEMVADYLNTI